MTSLWHKKGKTLSSFSSSHVLSVHHEGDGAVDTLRAASFCKSKQEVHHFPHLGQFCDPLPELSRVCLIALSGRVLGSRSPEHTDGLQQLARHQVGEIRRPELRGGRDGEAPWLRQPHRPVGEAERLLGEVQPVHSLVGPQQALALLPLLAALLQGLDPQAHHLCQLAVQPEIQFSLCRHPPTALAVDNNCRLD